MSWDQYSETPASNDLATYFQTGMAPSKVKNAGWDMMADMCQQMGPGSLVTSGGSANAQTITNTRQVGALYAGRIIEFLPGFTNTGTMTIAEDGLTAKQVNANGAAAIAGMVVSGVIARLRYDGTNYQLLNPQRSTGSFTLTLTGVTASGTINYSILQDGKTVYVWANSSITAASSSTQMTGTGVPAALSSANEHRVFFQCEDNTLQATSARLGATNTTTWVFYNGLATTSWTNGGNKGILAGAQTSYTLD